MERVYIYSDESRGRDRIVVAGIAVSAHANVIKRKLLRAETDSGKGMRDWHRTKDPRVRRRYIEEVLQIPQLKGCAFYRAYWDDETDPFTATVQTLEAAAKRFAEGRTCVLVHEGFTRKTRDRMKSNLRAAGRSDLTVEAGSIGNEPRVRLADALAGFSRVVCSGGAGGDVFAGLDYEDWLLDLDA